MLKRILAGLLITAVALHWNGAMALTNQQHRELQQAFDRSLQAFKVSLAGSILSDREKLIFDSIKYDVRWFDGLIAHADIQSGQRLVTISTGLIYILNNLKATEIHSGLIPGDTCYFDYQKYIFLEIAKHNTAIGSFLAPDELAGQYCVCQSFSYANLSRSRWKLAVTNGLTLSTLFVVLHEAAHHIKGDVTQSAGYNVQVELAADRWALETASRAGFVLQPATGAFGLLMALEESAVAIPTEKSIRFDNLIATLVRELNDKSLPRHLPSEAYDQAVKATLEYAEWARSIRSENVPVASKRCDRSPLSDYDDVPFTTMHGGR